mgnify:CR=1 FL=1
MNNLEKLIANITVKIIEMKQQQLDLLNNIMYIENIKHQLSTGEIQNVDIKALETIINKIGIDEDEIFQQLHHILEDFAMDDEITPGISREKEIELLLTTFKHLQEYADSQEDLEEEIVESYISILIEITESLYNNEVQNIRNSTAYKDIDREIKELETLLALLNKQENLTIEEKDKIYEYIVNSNLEDKISIYIELASKWIEQAKVTRLIPEEQVIELSIEEPITSFDESVQQEIETIQEKQRAELSQLTGEMAKEDWEQLILKTINIVKENTNLTQEQKSILEKILLISLKEELEDLNMAKDVLNEYSEITIDTRNYEYLNSSKLETNLVGVDLVIHLIPNITDETLSDIKIIIESIVEKFQQLYLSNDELEDTKKFFQENQEKYSQITYIELDNTQAQLIELEEKFIEFEGSKDKLLNYDAHTNKIIPTNAQYNQFALNTFMKIIKTKLAQLDTILKNTDNQLVKRKEVEQLREEIAKWTSKYEYAVQLMEVEITYRNYTVDEMEKIDFSNKNAIVFLRGESGKTLYEEGLITNGFSQSNIISRETSESLVDIMKHMVNNTINLKTNYDRFIDDVKATKTNGEKAVVKIGDKILERASINHENARLALIRLTISTANKIKLGISPSNGVILVLGAFEVKLSKYLDVYSDISKQARHYEEQIKKIMEIFENPDTPREVLLQYLADSYGLLESLIEETPQPVPGGELKKGGRIQWT